MIFKKLVMALAALTLCGAALAAEDIVEIELDGAALSDEISVRPIDRDTTNTAVVASNMGSRTALVVCWAYNANGQKLGKARMRVPAYGLRYLRASQLSNGVDYVGQVRCTTRNLSVAGSAFLLGPGGVTNLPVEQQALNGALFIQAPVTASF